MLGTMTTTDDHDRGLAFDLTTLIGRRRLFALAGASAGAALLAACGSGGSSGGAASSTSSTSSTGSTGSTGSTNSTDSTNSTSGATSGASCAPIPEETAGPYPGDGSNGPDALAESGIVRSDIRSSIGSASGVADGIPLTVELTVTDTANGCAPLAGAAIYLWHCDREGRYSMYSPGAENENYLRGVQETDADGRVTFTTIFPACYSGRWPHIHFEVYSGVDDATGGGEPIATSQLAFPADVCTTAYATEGYEQSVTNLAQVSLDSDMVFADGVSQQLASMSGDGQTGYAATLSVPI
jgi:protocatechuate 3,4-dioxygenase beta subunit